MRELGYVEGKDFIIEWRSAEGKYERFPDLAAELVRLKVDVITAFGDLTPRIAHRRQRLSPLSQSATISLGLDSSAVFRGPAGIP